MEHYLENPWRGQGMEAAGLFPLADAGDVAGLLRRCPAHAPTPLRNAAALAADLGVGALWLKDERARMGLGSFKALGAAHAIAVEAVEALEDLPPPERTGAAPEPAAPDWSRALEGRTFVTASAGNHGLSVAAGARVFGAAAVVYLAETVPDAFADRLRARGAWVVRAGASYEESMAAAEAAAEARGWTLLSDSSWPGYTALPRRVMEGYLQLIAETAAEMPAAPSHVLVQAGVGGLAAAVAAHVRAVWGQAPTIAVVEPAAAPALAESIRAGRLVTASGPVSAMGRLDCKTPSLIALAGLARDADLFVTISEAEAAAAVSLLAAQGLATTPSGAAGLAAGLAGLPGLGSNSRVLAFLTEGPESPEPPGA